MLLSPLAYRSGDVDIVRIKGEITTGDSDLSYDLVLFDAAGKRIAWEIVQGLNVRINQLRSMTIASTNRREPAIAEMTAIMNAIRSRNPDQADAAARRHVEQAWHIAQELLRSR